MTKTTNIFPHHPISSESRRQERQHHGSISNSGIGLYFTFFLLLSLERLDFDCIPTCFKVFNILEERFS